MIAGEAVVGTFVAYEGGIVSIEANRTWAIAHVVVKVVARGAAHAESRILTSGANRWAFDTNRHKIIIVSLYWNTPWCQRVENSVVSFIAGQAKTSEITSQAIIRTTNADIGDLWGIESRVASLFALTVHQKWSILTRKAYVRWLASSATKLANCSCPGIVVEIASFGHTSIAAIAGYSEVNNLVAD